MRRFHVCASSTSHLPVADRETFERLIREAPRCQGRIIVDHVSLSIEAHQYGFAIHLGLFDDHPGRPDNVSPTLWALMLHARRTGATWLLFDDGEPVSPLFPVFPPLKGTGGAHGQSSGGALPPARPFAVRCEACRGSNFMRDASARWDEHSQIWSLGTVFDAAFCGDCEADATLVREPLAPEETAA